MAGISLILQNNPNVTQINCGASSPRLGGTVDISAFPNLQQFRCNNHDITALSGYAQNSNLTLVEFFQNKVTGPIPSLSGLNNLQTFRCFTNQLTGFNGGPVSNILGSFQAQNNQLPSTSVNVILSAFVAANKTAGTRILNLGGVGNAAPAGQGITDKATLVSIGWTVTTN